MHFNASVTTLAGDGDEIGFKRIKSLGDLHATLHLWRSWSDCDSLQRRIMASTGEIKNSVLGLETVVGAWLVCSRTQRLGGLNIQHNKNRQPCSSHAVFGSNPSPNFAKGRLFL